jgi:hypothetical protein
MRQTRYLFSSFIVLTLASCSSLYMPNVPNTPMLSSKGELNAAGHITLRGNVSVNSAYAVSEHFGVLLNGSVMNSNRTKKDFKHNLIETGAGYFNTFGPGNNRIFEKDKTNTGLITEDRQEINFSKSFLQVNYSSKKKQDLNLFGARFPLNYGTALRVSYVNMKEFLRNDALQPKEDNIFLEPVFFTRMALSNSVQIQYTSGSNFGLKNRKFLTAGNSVFSIGLVINVGGRDLSAPTGITP